MDINLALESGLAHTPVCQLCLLSAQGDADDPGPVVAGSMQRHRSPSAADIKKAHARPFVQTQLATDQIVLGLLGCLQRHGLSDESPTRIGHAWTEHKLVEVIADVVVVADDLCVTLLGVSDPSRFRLCRRSRQGRADGTNSPCSGESLRK